MVIIVSMAMTVPNLNQAGFVPEPDQTLTIAASDYKTFICVVLKGMDRGHFVFLFGRLIVHFVITLNFTNRLQMAQNTF